MDNKKTIWILHQYGAAPEVGIAGRWYYLSKHLSKYGYKVYLVVAGYTHIMREPPILRSDYKIENVSDDFNLVWIKTLCYKNGLSLKRILNWFLFAYKTLKLPKILKDAPDIVISSSPSMITTVSAEKLAKKYKAKLMFDVRDIWPMVLCDNAGYSKFHPFIMLLQYLEDRAYRKSDYILSPLGRLDLHVKDRGGDANKFRWFENGIDIDEVSDIKEPSAKILEKIPKDKFLIGYTGTLCIENSLDCLIDAAKVLRQYENICYVIVGDGALKQKSIEATKDLKNFIFIDALPKKQVQFLLQRVFDACYATGPRNKSLDFGLASVKHPEYLFSGKPMIYNKYGFIGEDVESYGVFAEAKNPESLAKAILKLYNMNKDNRAELGENGKKLALEKYDYSKIAARLNCFFENL